MIIPDKLTHLINQDAVIAVTSKEHGLLFRLKDGEVTPIEHLEHSEPTYSDNEGFFFKGGISGGAPDDNADEAYKQQLDKMIATELSTIMHKESPHVLYVFEPEHFKGRITKLLDHHVDATIHTVKYGNYVQESLGTILEHINQFIAEHIVDTKHVDFEHDLDES